MLLDVNPGQDSKSMLAKSRNSYLVLIGSDSNKYCFLYQPESLDLFCGFIVVWCTPLEGRVAPFSSRPWWGCTFITLSFEFVFILTYRPLWRMTAWETESTRMRRIGTSVTGGMRFKWTRSSGGIDKTLWCVEVRTCDWRSENWRTRLAELFHPHQSCLHTPSFSTWESTVGIALACYRSCRFSEDADSHVSEFVCSIRHLQ